MNVVDRHVDASRDTPSEALAWCPRCGLSLREAAVQHDLSLVLALLTGSCPRCDGTLKERVPQADPSLYLG